VSDRRSAVRTLPAAAFFLAGLVAAPAVVHAQPSDADPGEDVTARVAVEPVVMVSPRGPVAVTFPSPETSAPPAKPVEAGTRIRLTCAGNTAHEARIRLVSTRERPAGSGPVGELQWTTDRGDGWTPLRAEPARVAGTLEPGRREDCATVRVRWVPPETASTARPPAETSVAFDGASVGDGGGDAPEQ
jgi:hypothetical protein